MARSWLLPHSATLLGGPPSFCPVLLSLHLHPPSPSPKGAALVILGQYRIDLSHSPAGVTGPMLLSEPTQTCLKFVLVQMFLFASLLQCWANAVNMHQPNTGLGLRCMSEELVLCVFQLCNKRSFTTLFTLADEFSMVKLSLPYSWCLQ